MQKLIKFILIVLICISFVYSLNANLRLNKLENNFCLTSDTLKEMVDTNNFSQYKDFWIGAFNILKELDKIAVQQQTQ
jgi:hypothetical protein